MFVPSNRAMSLSRNRRHRTLDTLVEAAPRVSSSTRGFVDDFIPLTTLIISQLSLVFVIARSRTRGSTPDLHVTLGSSVIEPDAAADTKIGRGQGALRCCLTKCA